jgi:WD40 repeat protein/TolB-like protein
VTAAVVGLVGLVGGRARYGRALVGVRLGLLASAVWCAGPASLTAQGVLSTFPHLDLPEGRTVTVASSPDGRLVALGGTDGHVRVLDAESGREVQRIRAGSGAVVGLGFQPSGSRFFAALEDRRIVLIDLISADVVGERRTDKKVRALDVSADGRSVVWCGDDGAVEILSEGLQPMQRLSAPNLYGKEVRFVSFGLGDREVFAAGEGGLLAWWAVGREDPLRTETLTRQEILAVARDPGGSVLALGVKAISIVRARTGAAGGAMTAQASNTIRILDWERGRTLREIEELPDEVRSLAWAPNRSAVVAGLRDGTLAAYSVEEGRRLATLNQGDEVIAADFSADGRWITGAFKDGGGRSWRASGAEAVAQARPVYQSDELLGRTKYEFTSAREPLIGRAEQRTVAVLRLAAMGVEESLAGSVSELLMSRMANYPNITSIERSAVDAVLEELRFQNTGITSSQEAARIGELLNAGVVVLGSMNQLGTSYVISVRLVETESARILGARELVCNGCRPEDLPGAVGVLAESIVEGR